MTSQTQVQHLRTTRHQTVTFLDVIAPPNHAFFSVQLCIDLLKIADYPPVHAEGRLGGAEGVAGDLGGAELGSCVQEVERNCYDQGGGSESGGSSQAS